MNSEKYNQIIDEAYKNFIDKTKGLNLNLEINKDIIVVEGPIYHATPRLLSQEEFINKCKVDSKFSEKWGLKIEERELSLEERCELGYKYVDPFEWDMLMGGGQEGDEGNCNDYNIPTKQITLEYNQEKIYYYE